GSGGTMADLGTLGGRFGDATAINNAGQITGSSYVAGDVAYHAFLYTGTPGSGGSMADLGTLGGQNSRGFAINVAGQIVGWSSLLGVPSTFTHAILYTGTPGVDGQMIDLDAWLDAVNPVEGAKWTLGQALGLNNAGLITGGGTYNDGPGGLSDGS